MSTRQAQKSKFDYSLFSAFSSWNEIAQLGLRAAQKSYAYDLDVMREDKKRKAYTGEFLEGVKLYRSTDEDRSSFILEADEYESIQVKKTKQRKKVGREFSYISAASSDQMAVFRHETTMLLGFRGTDTRDPIRFLGFLPSDFEDTVQNLFNSRKPYLESELNTFASRFTYNKLQQQGGLKYSNLKRYLPAFCGCEQLCETSERVNLRPDMHKAFYIENAIKKYGELGLSVLNPVLPTANMSGREVVFEGGAYKAATWSDFVSDLRLSRAGGLLKSKFFSRTDETDDPKHEDARKEAVLAFTTFLELMKLKGVYNPTVVVSGHSLGGSLAFYAYFHIKKYCASIKSKATIYFVGFNAAQLKNFDSLGSYLTSHIDPNWKKEAIHYRNQNDIVSAGTGDADGYQIPSVSYALEGRKADLFLAQSSDSLTHGLEGFKFCKTYISRFTDTFGAKIKNYTEGCVMEKGSFFPVCKR